VTGGSVQQEIFRRLAPPGAALTLTAFHTESAAAVIDGRADFAVIGSLATPGEVDKTYPALKVAVRLGQVRSAYAVRPDSDLLPEIDRWLAAARSSGELARTLERYQIESASLEPVPAPRPQEPGSPRPVIR
jgi:ABC-type amino acid transport substrate-binding protein